MTIHWTELHPLNDVLFTHIDTDENKTQRNFAITRLIYSEEYLSLPVIVAEIPIEAYKSLTSGVRYVEKHRLERITPDDFTRYPVTFATMPDDTQLLIDGTHRVLKYYQHGLNKVLARIVPQTMWEKYLVSGIPDMDEKAQKRFMELPSLVK